MKHTKKHIWSSVMILIIVFVDQFTKYLAKKYLSDGTVAALTENFIQFRYTENQGMAFSMFSGARWILVALTAVLCAVCLWVMFANKTKSLWLYWSLGVITAGGVGNLIDRVWYGYVIDFIEPLFVNFAVFNIADCAVSCGAAALIGYLLFDTFKKEKKDV